MEIQLWRSILCPYELAVKELTVKFKHMIEEYHENDRYSPIEQVSGRVKSVSSILEKMQRKDIPIEQLETEMEDLAKTQGCAKLKDEVYSLTPARCWKVKRRCHRKRSIELKPQ